MMKQLSRKTKFRIVLGIAGAIILVSLSIVFYGIYQIFFDPASLFRKDFMETGDVEKYFGDRIVNVAVLGLQHYGNSHRDEPIYRVDTVMVASINFDEDSLLLISIPRDAYVEIAHLEIKDKISRSYRYGYLQSRSKPHEDGLRTAFDTASLAMGGVKLHYYIAMDLEGLMQLIDSMGGVEFYVDIPVGGLYRGPQLLDGTGYMAYMTYREEDARDDLKRIERQRKLLMATFKHFKEAGRFRSVAPTYRAYRRHVHTNLGFNQVAALAVFAGDRLELDQILTYSLQGKYQTLGGEEYLVIDEEARLELIEELFQR